MHKPESVPINVTHKIFQDFGIQMGHRIPNRRPDWVLIKEKHLKN